MDISTPRIVLNSVFNSINWSKTPISGTNYEKYAQFIPVMLIGLILSLLLTPIIGQIALKHDITYKPGKSRKGKDYDNSAKAIHKGITPALGGLAITIPALLAMLFFFKLDSFTIPVILSMFVLVIGSTFDDIFNLPAKIQFLYQLIAAVILSFSIIDLTDFFSISLNLHTFSFSILGIAQSLVFPGDIILVLWILVCINAFKWTAGSPGIIECNSLIIFSLIFVIAIRFQSIFATTISAILVGALLIFTVFALPPQKIMTGSTGKSVYGFLICTLSMIADTKISTSIMLLALPLIDFIYVIIKRQIKFKPKNFAELMKINGADHFHHQLIALGLSRINVVLVEAALTLAVGSLAILTTGAHRLFFLVLVLTLSVTAVVLMNILANKKSNSTKERPKSPESKYSY
ncbi:undecaprenyl/decaprenyl-phosphate alpha-N-acetylglucosaminyl 1-phosphate transferase [bacterium]|nr:undecaprenyl/decaprenyl-phosphate alpha-N-acetylglucosaminyl 1-phosphate transferase [bacterium]